MKLEGQLWFAHEGQNLAGQGRIELLQQIADTGSISKAAKAAGMSYKTAWDAVDAMNKATGSPLVERSVGGKGGGGGPRTTTRSYRYYANFAVALAAGPVSHVGAIWADGMSCLIPVCL